MMTFTRPKRPGYLDNYKKWGREYAEKKQQGLKPKWHKKIKQWEQLKSDLTKLTADHCSFCDSYPLVGKNHQTIEHFRPRSRYPKLAYVWHNLFLCCETCQTAKGDNFNKKLLKPDAIKYDFNRYFIVNFKTGKIEVNTRASLVDQERAKITIAIYGLNNYNRQKLRYDHYNLVKNKVRKKKIKLNQDRDILSYRFMFL
jgi:uncharacterized protein (TIGR02646 family)